MKWFNNISFKVFAAYYLFVVIWGLSCWYLYPDKPELIIVIGAGMIWFVRALKYREKFDREMALANCSLLGLLVWFIMVF